MNTINKSMYSDYSLAELTAKYRLTFPAECKPPIFFVLGTWYPKFVQLGLALWVVMAAIFGDKMFLIN